MKRWLYQWLPLIFGCHCRPDRSFSYRGRPFPICARCTGELIGFLAALLTCWLLHPAPWVCALLLLPMLADGAVQLKTRYESTNPRRVVTGALFGYGVTTLILLSLAAVFRWGYSIGLGLR